MRTRRASGAAPWPVIAVTGEPKKGKSHLAFSTSEHPAFGRVAVIEVGERQADGYGQLFPDLEIVDPQPWDWKSFAAAVKACVTDPDFAAPDMDKPNVLVIDSLTAAHDMLRAAYDDVLMKRARKKFPNSDDIPLDMGRTPDIWNGIRNQVNELQGWLSRFPGVVLVTMIGRDKTVFENGNPTNRKEWAPEGPKDFDKFVSGTLRCLEPGKVQCDGATIPGSAVGKGTPVPDGEHPVAWLLRQWPGRFEMRTVAEPTVTASEAKTALVAQLGGDKEAAIRAWSDRFGDSTPTSVSGDVLAQLVASAMQSKETSDET